MCEYDYKKDLATIRARAAQWTVTEYEGTVYYQIPDGQEKIHEDLLADRNELLRLYDEQAATLAIYKGREEGKQLVINQLEKQVLDLLITIWGIV